jgi:hypothetical protein
MGSIAGLPWEIRRSSFGARMYRRMAPGVPFSQVAEDVARVGREVHAAEGGETALPSLRGLQDYVVEVRDRRGSCWRPHCAEAGAA